MPLTGFDDNTQKHSKAIALHSNSVLLGLSKRTKKNPVTSQEIEASLSISGPVVRAIVAHLRHEGHPIASHGRGYHYDITWRDITETIKHMTERRNAIGHVITSLTDGYKKAQAQHGPAPIQRKLNL